MTVFAYVDDVFDRTVSPVMVESDLVGPPFSFAILLDFLYPAQTMYPLFHIWI